MLTVNDHGLLHRGILKLYELNYDYLRVIRKATFCRLHSLGSVWKKLPSKQRRTNREGLISQKSSQKPVISIFSYSFFQMNLQETLFWRREKAFFTRWFWLKLFPRSEVENASQVQIQEEVKSRGKKRSKNWMFFFPLTFLAFEQTYIRC